MITESNTRIRAYISRKPNLKDGYLICSKYPAKDKDIEYILRKHPSIIWVYSEYRTINNLVDFSKKLQPYIEKTCHRIGCYIYVTSEYLEDDEQ